MSKLSVGHSMRLWANHLDTTPNLTTTDAEVLRGLLREAADMLAPTRAQACGNQLVITDIGLTLEERVERLEKGLPALRDHVDRTAGVEAGCQLVHRVELPSRNWNAPKLS